MRERVEGQEGNLIVFDCAPGFSKMEQELLKTCYDMKLARKTQVLMPENGMYCNILRIPPEEYLHFTHLSLLK